MIDGGITGDRQEGGEPRACSHDNRTVFGARRGESVAVRGRFRVRGVPLTTWIATQDIPGAGGVVV